MPKRRDIVGGIAVSMGLAATGPQAARAQPTGPKQEEGFVPRGGGVIHWVAMGQGPVVVLMPKLGGWAADWRHVAPLLADRFRVVVVDPPGHGGSRMATPAPYIQSVPESAAMVRAALQELGITRYALVGNSLGGCIGLVMSALWPQDVTHMVALSSAMLPAAKRADLPMMDAEVAADFHADWTPRRRSYEQMNARFGITREIHEEMNASRAAAGPWARSSERGVFVADTTAYLPRITAPTLLIYGTSGPYPQYRDTGMKLIPHVEAASVAGGGSFVHQEKPRETAELLGGFLAR